jgi:transposase, IS5 family
VSAPKRHNSETRTFSSREENETIKEGETPEDWKSQLARNRQKDKDARWTKKHERSYFGYKNHIGVDRRHKLVRRYVVSDASVHDSQEFEDVLDTSNTASDVWSDSAYRSQEIEEKLGRRGLKNRIRRRAYRNRKLGEAQKAANTTRSKVRARVEHVFGDQKNAMGAEIVRTIGIVRARCRIGMTNLVHNMRRL